MFCRSVDENGGTKNREGGTKRNEIEGSSTVQCRIGKHTQCAECIKSGGKGGAGGRVACCAVRVRR